MTITRVLRRLALVSFSVLALTTAAPVSAQDCPAGSTCFYVPPAMIHPGGPDLVETEMWLSIPSGAATGSYRVDGGIEVSFSITDAAAQRIPLMLTATSTAVDTPENRGVFVVSDREDLLVEHKQSLFASGTYTEGYSETVPRHTVALGTRFRLGGYRMTRASGISYALTSQYAMITAPAGATVTLTAPPGATLPFWTGSATDTHTIVLAAGQSVSVAANALLDGALVTATAPISVAAGGRGWHPGGCGDNGSDVLVPTSQYGTDFAVRLPTGTASETNVSVIADVAGTEVRVDGALVATLGPGETYSFMPTTPASIATSVPALVWMNGSFRGCEMDTALIPPLELVALPLAITFNASFNGEAAAVIPTTSVATLRLDGGMITPTSSTAVPGRTDITIVVFDITPGLHTVRADHGFQLLATSAGAGAGILAYFGPFVSCITGAECEDVGPCTVEECLMSACVATPIAAGMPGDCAAGLVCSGASATPPNTCVTPAPDAGPPDAGPPDAGPLPPADSGPTPAPDSGPPPMLDSGPAGADAGGRRSGGSEEGGCGCTTPTTRPHSMAWLSLGLLAGAVLARRLRRRAQAR